MEMRQARVARETLFYVSMNLKGIIDISFVILYKKK